MMAMFVTCLHIKMQVPFRIVDCFILTLYEKMRERERNKRSYVYHMRMVVCLSVCVCVIFAACINM